MCARAPQSDAVAEILRSFPDGAFVVPAESVGLSVIRALLEVAKPSSSRATQQRVPRRRRMASAVRA